MNKLLCVVGPTGTGKTAKAIELSKDQPSILVSADSRQVYRGMDIVTGKDHPKDIIIYGIDIIGPDEQCSVSLWYDSVMPHIYQAWDEGKLPIVVGGTGLYVKALTDGIGTMQVPIHQSLRDQLDVLSIPELQNKLNDLDQTKFNSMNHSDVNNPRRLIRAIEVATYQNKGRTFVMTGPSPLTMQSKIIGLKYSDHLNPSGQAGYQSKIRQRVLQRIEAGAVQETKSLLCKYDKNIQSMTSIGYKSIVNFLENHLTEEEMIEEWVSGEFAYAKRQLTWFRKQPVIWYDVDSYANNKS